MLPAQQSCCTNSQREPACRSQAGSSGSALALLLPHAGVCLSLFGLQRLLSWFGFDDAFCEQFDGQASAGLRGASGLLLPATPAPGAAAAGHLPPPLPIGDRPCFETNSLVDALLRPPLQWWPLRGQVSVGGEVSLGWSIAGLWARLDGRMQLVDWSSNPMCRLFDLDDWWGCQDFCNWYAGDGQATATVGWDFLWFGDSSTATVLDTYVPSC